MGENKRTPYTLLTHTQDQFIPIFSIVEQNIVCFINVPYPGKQLHNYILFDIIRPKLYGGAVDARGAYYREKPGNLCTRIEFLAAGTALFSSGVQTFSKRAELSKPQTSFEHFKIESGTLHVGNGSFEIKGSTHLRAKSILMIALL